MIGKRSCPVLPWLHNPTQQCGQMAACACGVAARWVNDLAAAPWARLIPREDRTLRKIALTLAAFGLAAAPLAAQSDVDASEEGAGVSYAPIIVFALAAIAVGIAAGGDDEPVSA